MGHETDLEHWLQEARDRYWGANSKLENMHIWQNESAAHFAMRRERQTERVQRRENIKDHLAKKLDALRKHKDEHANGDGLASFDGKTVAAWMEQWLKKSREAGWTGTVTSGYRTPEYSESLCYAMCGAPTCPGTCAGRSSNHSGKTYPAGAVDVTDYTNFERIQYEIGSPLRNNLPLDPVHFSVSGH